MSTAGKRNYHLDVIRVLAAFSVLFTHLRAIFFIPYRETTPSFLVRILYIDHYLARAGVICFFVLSGYLVGFSVLNSVRRDRWSWPAYLVRRITRLEIVLLPALLITAIFDAIGARISGSSLVYAVDSYPHTWKSFLGCIVFLQEVVSHILPFGSDGALWSLSYEFWYYILFPVLVLMLLTRRRLFLSLPIAAAIVWLTWGAVLFLFPCWLGGIAAGYAARRRPLSRPVRLVTAVASAIGLLAITLACGAHRINLNLADYLFGLCTVTLLWACLCMPLRSPSSRYAQTVILLSEFSYTLYLTHQPFLFLLKVIWLRDSNWTPTPAHVLLAGAPFAGAIVFAYACYLLFESRTDAVRSYIQRKLRLERPGVYS